MQISLNHLNQLHDLSCTLCHFSERANEKCFFHIKILEEEWITPLFLKVVYQLLLVADPYLHKLTVKAFGVEYLRRFEVLDLRQDRSEELEMCKPFTLIINVLCDQLTEVPVAIMDPLSWIDSWLD